MLPSCMIGLSWGDIIMCYLSCNMLHEHHNPSAFSDWLCFSVGPLEDSTNIGVYPILDILRADTLKPMGLSNLILTGLLNITQCSLWCLCSPRIHFADMKKRLGYFFTNRFSEGWLFKQHSSWGIPTHHFARWDVINHRIYHVAFYYFPSKIITISYPLLRLLSILCS